MKVLIIGGTGTISSAVAERCIAKGYETVLLNRGNHGHIKGAVSITADINKPDTVIEALGNQTFDVTAEFVGYTPEQVERDISLFSNRTKQYIFISSASAYQKPIRSYPITEETPLDNPYWEYSRNKAQCEHILMEAYKNNGFPVTIVRPSHTYDEAHVPVAVHGDNGCWQVLSRILMGKKVIIPGDGTSLWTATFNTDFAKGYCGLIGNRSAVGEAFHITTDEVMPWDQIYNVIASALGRELHAVHIPTEILAECGKQYDLRGALMGDKSNSVIFDNTKIKRFSPEFRCTVSMEEGISRAAGYMAAHMDCQKEDAAYDCWSDKIIDRYSRL